MLFHPSDVGINQAGVAEAAGQALAALSPAEAGLASAAVLLTGGNVKLPQFRDRFEADLRPLVADWHPLHVHLPQDPDTYAWRGMRRYAHDAGLGYAGSGGSGGAGDVVSRAEYLEHGHLRCNLKYYHSW